MADAQRFQSLAFLLAQGSTVRVACQQTGIPERTAYRVVKRPAFRRLVRRCRARLWRQLAGQLVASCEDAVSTLRRLAADDTKPASARVTACRGLIDAAMRVRDAADIEGRLAALERRLEGNVTVD
jgi:hypothetical protein